MTYTRVNSSTIGASGTTAAAFATPVGVNVQVGDLLIVSANCNGTHVSNGMSFINTTTFDAFTTLQETQQGGASARWQQTFYWFATSALSSTDNLELTPYAANTQATFVVDVFRGVTSGFPYTSSSQSGASGTSATGLALPTIPTAGDLVISLATVSGGTATAVGLTAASNRVNTPTAAIAYTTGDGVSNYAVQWNWGTSNTSAIQTVAFPVPATGPVVGRPAVTTRHPGVTPAKGARFRIDVTDHLSYDIATAAPADGPHYQTTQYGAFF